MKKEMHVQVNSNSPSIERILRPITYTSWLLGIGAAHPRKCPKAITIIIRIIYIIVCSITLIYDAKNSYTYIEELRIYDYMLFLKKAMAYVSAYYCMYHGIRQYNQWPELMDRFKEIDHKIEKEISMNDQSIKIFEALAISATIFYMSIPVVHYIIDRLSINLLFHLILHEVIFVQLLFSSFVFDVVVYVLYCRFQTINKLIGQLDKLSDAMAFKIKRIRELHIDVYDLVSKVNDIYSFYLLFGTANSFTMAVASLFQFYDLFDLINKGFLLFISLQTILCVVFITQFCLTCWICTLAREESDRTGRIIYEIILKCQPVNIDKQDPNNISRLEVRPPLVDLDDGLCSNRSSSHNLSYVDMDNHLHRNLDRECVIKEINDFSLQLQQHRVVFTACNFFEISNDLFRGRGI
ncbi:uncharacterized protein LOC113003077 isoform X2 [Solenopsis invicta]|uniref:uncharacterized protein LOC113003077 isoform X2 n=1 Tax=Solenopsis invicta TaxID=13686 RepID=UPI00193DD2CF|nr:uncharacterized protein LOC113003077 isoform X2 [Solenopsis invicta]